MTIARRFLLLVPVMLSAVGAGCAHFPQLTSSALAETISLRVSEGTMLSVDASADAIVFDLYGQLWLLPRTGGHARAVTDAVADTADDQDPSFSPDGKRVVFRAERRGRIGIWLLDLQVKQPVLLAEVAEAGGFIGHPTWSPDGRQIAYARELLDSATRRRVSRIALLDVATRAVHDVRIDSMELFRLRSPGWSADGQRIAFVALAQEPPRVWRRGRLFVVDTTGGAPEALSKPDAAIIAPAFSPDGRRVAYLAPDADARLQVWTRDLSRGDAGDATTRLTNHADVAATRVRWSTDGAWLYYSADGKIRRVPSTGGRVEEIPFVATLSLTRVRPVLHPVRFPEPGQEQPARGYMGLAISRDAARIGALALGKLWVIPVGGPAHAVADVPHTARYLAWSPDGSELAWSAGTAFQQDVFATNVHSGATRRVTSLPGREILAEYSPDGKYIAFAHAAETTTLRIVGANERTVTDTAATRNLGPVRVDWTGGSAMSSHWSPESDALLVGPRSRVTAEVVSLSGERKTVPIPNLPIFATWTRDALTYVRHDRLWRVAFDRRGASGVPAALGDAPALYASTALDGTVLFMSDDGLRVRSPSGVERTLGWPIRYSPPVPRALLIRNVRLIDGTNAPLSSPKDLLIERGRITRIAAAGTLPAGSRSVIDAAGRYAMPGLMDLHAHVYLPELLPGYAAFGVTLVRDQGSSIGPLAAYADAIAAGTIPGPRVSYGGFQFYSDAAMDDEQGRGIEPEADPQHVRRSIALAEALGAHHIKVRTFRRWDINARMIEEAHRRGIRVTGHCVDVLALIVAGMDAKEHLGMCPRRGEPSLPADMIQYADELELLKAARVSVVPTLSFLAFAARVNEHPQMFAADTALSAFVMPMHDFAWMTSMDADTRANFVGAAAHARETTAKLARAGVRIATGTDIWQFPTAVHLELEELVAAGLSPLAVIRAGTSEAARTVGVERDLGTLEVGKLADLILLDANPLTDIRNTRRIWKVIKGGAVVDRAGITQRYPAPR